MRDEQPEGPAYRPPPPGSREAVLPDDVLALIEVGEYLSTGCDTGQRLDAAAHRREDLPEWSRRMHLGCRRTHKYTFRKCICHCHQSSGTPASAG